MTICAGDACNGKPEWSASAKAYAVHSLGRSGRQWREVGKHREGLVRLGLGLVVLQVSNADKCVPERLSCVLRLPNRKGCR
jgi:hypothetical protein